MDDHDSGCSPASSKFPPRHPQLHAPFKKVISSIILREPVEKLIFFRLIKNAQMQVEPCEIPFTGAPEILSIRPDHGRSEAYLDVPCNKPAPCLTRGRMKGNPAKRGTDGRF